MNNNKLVIFIFRPRGTRNDQRKVGRFYFCDKSRNYNFRQVKKNHSSAGTVVIKNISPKAALSTNFLQLNDKINIINIPKKNKYLLPIL